MTATTPQTAHALAYLAAHPGTPFAVRIFDGGPPVCHVELLPLPAVDKAVHAAGIRQQIAALQSELLAMEAPRR